MIEEFAPISVHAPRAPQYYHPPLQVAEDTWLIRQLQGEKEAPVGVYINSLVILGKEPVIVDTGSPANRQQWLADVQSLVDPKEVKWIYISHDDVDHTGNLAETLELCPDATLVSNWFQLERMTCELSFPLHRTRWVNDGETFSVGDRELAAIRPPVYDSPTTRGLYDSKTGVYWGSDFFATPVLEPVDNAGDMDRAFWEQGLWQFHSLLAPWHTMLDEGKFQREVDRIAELDLKVAVGAHSPPTMGKDIETVITAIRKLPTADPAPMPGQEVLEQMVAEMSGH